MTSQRRENLRHLTQEETHVTTADKEGVERSSNVFIHQAEGKVRVDDHSTELSKKGSEFRPV